MNENIWLTASTGAACVKPAPIEPPVAMQDVIHRHHQALLRFLRRRVRVAEDAFDVAQETYVRMLRYEGSREIESPSSMLFRIAANLAVDYRRAAVTRHAREHVALDAVQLESELPSAERTLAGEQKLRRTLAAMKSLSPKCREVFLLSRVRGMTYPEIARDCGISVKMVEKHVSHALSCMQRAAGAESVVARPQHRIAHRQISRGERRSRVGPSSTPRAVSCG